MNQATHTDEITNAPDEEHSGGFFVSSNNMAVLSTPAKAEKSPLKVPGAPVKLVKAKQPATPVKLFKVPLKVPGAPVKLVKAKQPATPVKLFKAPLKVPDAPVKPSEPVKRVRPELSRYDTEEFDLIRPTLRYTPNIKQIPQDLDSVALEDFYTQWHNQRVVNRLK